MNTVMLIIGIATLLVALYRKTNEAKAANQRAEMHKADAAETERICVEVETKLRNQIDEEKELSAYLRKHLNEKEEVINMLQKMATHKKAA